MIRNLAILAALLASAGCVSKLAQGRVERALINAGLSESNAACMAERMTDRLSIAQLRKLERLEGEKRSIADYVAAVRRVGDAEALSVIATSAALCTTGLAG